VRHSDYRAVSPYDQEAHRVANFDFICLWVINRCLLVGLLGLSVWSVGCFRKAASVSKAPVVYIASPYSEIFRFIRTGLAPWSVSLTLKCTLRSLDTSYCRIPRRDRSLVEKGDLLFQVDPSPFQALVDEARA
jgi:hypothetical protein